MSVARHTLIFPRNLSLITDVQSLETPADGRRGDAVSGGDSDGRSPPSWLPKGLAVAVVLALVVYLGLFWTPPELGGTDDPETEAPPTDGETTDVRTPQASFDFEYADGQVTVTHTGGDSYTGENTGELYVTVDGERRTAWSLPASAGDSVTVSTDPSTRLEMSVIWTAPGGGEDWIVADFELPAQVTTTPQAQFDFEYDGRQGTVAVTHAGGDVFDQENTGELYVAVDGERRQSWSLPASAGDIVNIEVEPDQPVTVVWTPPDAGGRAQVLGDFETPSGPSPKGTVQFREGPNGTVTVVYVGREPITAEDTRNVVVTGSGTKRVWELPVERGDTIRVNASAGEVIRVFRTGEDDTEGLLGTYEVGGRSRVVAPDVRPGV